MVLSDGFFRPVHLVPFALSYQQQQNDEYLSFNS